MSFLLPRVLAISAAWLFAACASMDGPAPTDVPASGDEVARAIQIAVKRDGLWYLVAFDPPASGIAHVEVRFAIVTKKPLDVDAALLTSTFGG